MSAFAAAARSSAESDPTTCRRLSTSPASAKASTCCLFMEILASAPASPAWSRRRCRCESPVSKTERLFGTDGVRARAGDYPLDHPTVRRLGAAVVRALPHGTQSPRILVGRDTRESGSWIEAELAYGATGEGAAVTSAGVIPTPAVAYLTRSAGFDAGVVISASHNPFEDNGIRVFSGRGEKFAGSVEREVEAIVADWSWEARSGAAQPVARADLVDAYRSEE